jgi:hypothetical protein
MSFGPRGNIKARPAAVPMQPFRHHPLAAYGDLSADEWLGSSSTQASPD